MKTNRRKMNRGFSMIDLTLVVATLVGIFLVVLPALTRPRRNHAPRISCTNNLKQLGYAFRIWAGDNNDKMPMQVSVTNGGAMELAEAGAVYAVFLVMSNELNTPKILFCPTDQKRTQAVAFDSAASNNSVVFSGNTNLSYFASLDANDTAPAMFLSGDDNFLINGDQNNPASGTPVQPGILTLKTNDLIAWSQTRHESQGNIALADCSVQGLSTKALRTALNNTGIETNRLAMP